jgi:hypothetical protein
MYHDSKTFQSAPWGAILILTLASSLNEVSSNGILYPRESESREVKSLDGIWHFRAVPEQNQDAGFVGKWFSSPLSHVSMEGCMYVGLLYMNRTL